MKLDPFIEAEKIAGHSLQKTCGLFEVSRSAYYQRRDGAPSARAVTDVELTNQIQAVHDESKGTYGSPRIHRELGYRGVVCGRRRVTRLMRLAGLEGRCKKRWRKTTVADPGAEAAKDLIQRHFEPGADIDRRYVGDITYIATWEGWAYLATVIDLASRKVVGWSLADHMRTELVEEALTMAFANRAPEGGVIFHSDRGCQYTSRDFADLARQNGVVLSVGRKGECWDNAVAESFFATIKRELVDTRAWPTKAGLHRAVFEYIEGWYNTRRLHSTLGYVSPSQYEALHHNANHQAA
jgi:putative transposase